MSNARDAVSEALAFAKQAQATMRKGPVCTICALPQNVRDALDALHSEGYGPAIKSRWLRSQGHEIKATTAGRHYLDGHHEKARA